MGRCIAWSCFQKGSVGAVSSAEDSSYKRLRFRNYSPDYLSYKSIIKGFNVTQPQPSDPSRFDLVSFDHAIQQIFLSPVFESHQNLVRTYWIRLHRLKGSLKQVIACVGIAERTVLSRTSFPAHDNYFVAQLTAFCLIWSTIEVKLIVIKSFWQFVNMTMTGLIKLLQNRGTIRISF